MIIRSPKAPIAFRSADIGLDPFVSFSFCLSGIRPRDLDLLNDREGDLDLLEDCEGDLDLL